MSQNPSEEIMKFNSFLFLCNLFWINPLSIFKKQEIELSKGNIKHYVLLVHFLYLLFTIFTMIFFFTFKFLIIQYLLQISTIIINKKVRINARF